MQFNKRKKISKAVAGFTLLEVLFAIALITVILTTTYSTQSYTLINSARTRNIAVATNLARNKLAETELSFEKMTFTEMPEEEEGNFEKPYEQFKWKKEVKEADFSALTEIMIAQRQDQAESGVKQEELTMMSKFQEYMKDSIRKVTLTIEWPDGTGTDSVQFSTLWVRYDAKLEGL